MESNFQSFVDLVRHPVKFRVFLFSKLPSAWFSGVRVKSIEENKCEVAVPFKWFSQNPFRSTYFACLSMAAELSTGALVMGYVYKRIPAISMLVVKTEGEYFKKATGKILFTCEDGALIKKTVEEAFLTGEPKSVIAKSVGKNNAGEVVAEFKITWSFKSKKEK